MQNASGTAPAAHAGHMPTSGRGLIISAWLTGIYFVIELAIGLWTGSIAVISDAFHTFSAVGGVLVALADKFGLPIHAVGVGEQIDDLSPFDPDEFAAALVGTDG